MKIKKINLKDYCTPSLIYLGISLIVLFSIIVQNIFSSDNTDLCIGIYKCTFSHKLMVLVLKIFYIIFWTWLLNYLCKKGYKMLSWFILLIPFLLAAVMIGLLLIQNPKQLNQIKKKINNSP
tara:strand:- start:328 stop:693 length:366 start_codon:yes stop_codon:yes gene_type:complete